MEHTCVCKQCAERGGKSVRAVFRPNSVAFSLRLRESLHLKRGNGEPSRSTAVGTAPRQRAASAEPKRRSRVRRKTGLFLLPEPNLRGVGAFRGAE